MTFSFNLIEKPFVPYMRLGGRSDEYGLRDVLLKAHEIAELRDGSPLVTVALHRLLLAILHRCYEGPKNSAERVAIRRTGCFDADRITSYFEKWADRFDLFHEKYPFYQQAGYEQDEPSSSNRLVKELSRGNNAALFDHTTDDPPIALTPGQAAREVIAEQVFAYSAGRGKKGEPHTRDAPTGRAAAVFALGETLFETLWLNLTVYNADCMR
jgi:CRISPR system Cascade subunit CasA